MRKILGYLRKAWPYLLLTALLLLAFYMRFYHLSWRGMTYDECLTEERSHWSLWHLWRFYITSRAPVNALVYFFDGRFFTTFFKVDVLREWQIRLPSAIFSFLTVPLFFLLGKRLKDNWTGLILASFGTVSLLLLTHAREARYYSFVCFFTTWLLIEAVDILKKAPGSRESLRAYALYALAAVGGMGSHQGFYFLFAFSNVFLCIYAFLPVAGLAWERRKEWKGLGFRRSMEAFKDTFSVFYQKFILLVLPCLVYCYQFLLVSGADKPYTPTGRGSATLISELSFSVVGGICQRLWVGAPFAHYVLYLTIAAFVVLLFSRLRLVAVYCFFVKLSTFVLLRLLTQRITYEQFRDKYIIFVLILDMLILSAALSCILEWCWALCGKVICSLPEWRKAVASWGRAFSTIGFCALICFMGYGAAESDKLFEEQLEGVRYVFDYLEMNYQPGDIVIYQAEPNSWIHKNCLYEQSIRPNTKNWVVKESIFLPYMKDEFKKKQGCYVWWILMYRPTKGFMPYFYHNMRAFGTDVTDPNAMIMCRSAEKVKTLADAIYLTAELFRWTYLHQHIQYENHLINKGLKTISLDGAVFTNLIARTISDNATYTPKTRDLLDDPNLEFYSYRLINEWYAGLKQEPKMSRPILVTPIERYVYTYLICCAAKDLPGEQRARTGLLRLKNGWWFYDRIYRFTHDEFPRPYITPEELENSLSLEEIYKNRVRFDAAYLTLNPDMAKDWNKLLKRARMDYNEKKHGKKLQNNP
ncbi:glycosyltransferase family 39 protein [bacterium]|nr:glycosyltransferase family 39 protein [bacterium]